MKKLIAFLLVAVMCLSFVACCNNSTYGQRMQHDIFNGLIEFDNGPLGGNIKEIDVIQDPGSLLFTQTIDNANIFGVCWTIGDSSALTRLTIENDPNALVTVSIEEEPVAAVGSGAGTSPFDNYAPWNKMKEYNVIDGQIAYSSTDSEFSRTKYDTVVYIPEFYVNIFEHNNTIYYYISDTEIEGFTKHPSSNCYIGRYTSNVDYMSVSGSIPLTNITRAEARDASSKKGNKWSQNDFAAQSAIQLLYLVEYANWDSQSTIGRGNVDNANSSTGIQESGGTDSMTYHTGRAEGIDGLTQVQYRNIENLWGNVSEWVDGINFYDHQAYVSTDYLAYSDNTTETYVNTGITVPATGYVAAIGCSTELPWSFIPKETRTVLNDTIAVPDKTCSDDGYRILLSSGNASAKNNGGLFFFNAYSEADRSYSSYGSRLLYHGDDKSNISDEDKIPVFHITVNGQTIPDKDHPDYSNYLISPFSYQFGNDSIYDDEARIRIRGTSSRWFPKKGYKIKLSSKKSIAGLPANKKYNLLASFMDPSFLRDYLAMSISYNMNSNSNRYAPRPILSQLYIDDEYQGLYLLLDDIGANNGKITFADYAETDIAIPFIIEMDTVAYREGTEGIDYFALGETTVFDYDGDGKTALLYVIDTPDPEDITQAQFEYIKSYITNCRQSLVNQDLETFCNYVDLDSFIDYFLLGELFRNTDMAGRSVYMYKSSVNGKLVFGPSWDFDYTCSRPYAMTPNTDYTLDNAKDRFCDYDWWKLFLEIDGATELVQQRYTNYLRDIYLVEIEEAKLYFDVHEHIIKENAKIWYSSYVDDTDMLVDNNRDWTFNYFELRLQMMDELFLQH